MYTKPSVTDLGTLRQLTQIGTNADCDGGIYGIADGTWIGCTRTS